MTVQHVSDLQMPIGQILDSADAEGLLIESQGRSPYAVLPLDDDLLDYLLERNPQFVADCQRIRESMRVGEFHTHAEVKRLLSEK
jgi:hypothetical protein